MSSSTTKLGLLKPDPAENWSVQNHFNTNMDKIDQFAGRLMMAKALSGSTNAEFVSNLASAVNQQVGLASLPIGATFTGSAEWAGTTFCQFMLTKIASNACNVHITNGATKDIIARFNINDFNVTSVVDILSKTIYNGTANSSYISALEGQVVKNGSVVSGYFVLTANADFSAQNITLISNLPAAYNQSVQLPCIGLSGSNIYKAARVRLTTSGTITTWYGFSFKSGESYLIPVNYICA